MLISKEWLAEYVALPAEITPQELASKFSLATAEIEGIIFEGEQLENIVVGEILSVAPHPKADRLRVCMIDVGYAAPVQIVCGGSNLEVGEKVAVALPGARVRWHGEGELITLEPTEIRGEKSFGMICAAEEIGLGTEFPAHGEKEILDLTLHTDALAGTPLAEALHKTGVIFEIDNKSLSNRPDLWGHIGVAREFAALYKTETMLPPQKTFEAGNEIQLSVDVADAARVPRYTAVAVSGVATLPAADFIQTRLRACGVTPINAIVDTLNYVMLETGQPMHAFDYDRIKEADGSVMLEVRAAGAAQKFLTLSGAEISVPADALMITNPARALVVAGIIGGTDAMVHAQTHTVILESAVFKAQSIRRTSNTIGVRTESSTRFEKSLDPEQTMYALSRAVELLQRQFPHAQVASNVVDVQNVSHELRVLTVTDAYMQAQLGMQIPHENVMHILHSLGFTVVYTPGEYQITVPSFRAKDMVGPEDILEEVVRLYGYAHMQPTLPRVAVRVIEESVPEKIAKKIKTHAAFAEKFHEINNYAFVRAAAAEAFGFDPEKLLQLANPLSSERPVVAPLLAINLLESAGAAEHTRDTVALFEIARVFSSDETEMGIGGEETKKIPAQPVHASFVFADRSGVNSFGVLRDVLKRTFFAAGYALHFVATAAPKSADIFCEEKLVGTLMVMHAKTARAFDCAYETVVAEIDLHALQFCTPRAATLSAASPFPAAYRDIACVFDESIKYENVVRVIQAAAPEIISVEAVDLYRSVATLGENKKSFTMRVGYQSDSHTLSGEELEQAHAAAMRAVEKLSGEIR